jgi:hypothetical protein
VIGRGPADYHPFTTIWLGPGQERSFLERAQFIHCDTLSPGGTATYEQVPVTYRVLGFTHHTWVHLGIPIQVVGVDDACGTG